MENLFQPILVHYIESTSMLQKFLAAIISEEWAREQTQMRRHHLSLSSRNHLWLKSLVGRHYHGFRQTLRRHITRWPSHLLAYMRTRSVSSIHSFVIASFLYRRYHSLG